MSADSTHQVADPTGTHDAGGPRIRTKVLVLVGILVALVLAGGVSYYASGSPDGLNRVAADHGFDETAKDSPTGDPPSPTTASTGSTTSACPADSRASSAS